MENYKEKIKRIRKSFESDTKHLPVEELKIKYLGKKSQLMNLLGSIKDLNKEEKVIVGKEGNLLRKYFEENLHESKALSGSKNNFENYDVTLPGKRKKIGRLHPHTIVLRKMNEIFKQMGFSVYSGPEIETDEYVFERMNLPKNHPARSLQDTLMIEEPEVLLRSHTSSVESRAMENEELPLRIVVPGRVFRYEDLNATNHFAFYQYEGLAISEDLTMADLKGTLDAFIKQFFGENSITRFRCKYYPQVEPGVGVDLQCLFCDGKGCQVCKYRGWLEMLGAGMVHPNSLRMNGIDPSKYSGFAWGMGFDRIVMQRFGIDDIRDLFNGELN